MIDFWLAMLRHMPHNNATKVRSLIPSVFGKVHQATYRRWSHEEKPRKRQGRHRKLSLSMQVVANTMAHDMVSKGLPFTVEIFRRLLEEKLVTQAVSWEWSRQFLIKAGLRYKVNSNTSGARTFTAGAADFVKKRLKMKLQWLMREFDVAPDKVWNMDESGVNLLPKYSRTWTSKGASRYGDGVQEQWPVNKAQCTLTLAVPMAGAAKPQLQVILQGKTGRSLPKLVLEDSVRVTHSKSHWATTATLVMFFKQVEEVVRADGYVGSWVMLLDCAPQHLGEAFRAEVAAKLPQCRLAFVRAGTTSIAQPCDVAYFRT